MRYNNSLYTVIGYAYSTHNKTDCHDITEILLKVSYGNFETHGILNRDKFSSFLVFYYLSTYEIWPNKWDGLW